MGIRTSVVGARVSFRATSGMRRQFLHQQFGDIYRGKTVLVTGHTGFKGSWMCRWLRELGAEVIGLGLAPDKSPNHHDLLSDLCAQSYFVDIRDEKMVDEIVSRTQPSVVFHLAAQPFVLRSYEAPAETFTTNVIGTLNLFLALKRCDSTRAIVCVTSDKVYKPTAESRPFVEQDRLGGLDPYSCSKACVELLVESLRASYFSAPENKCLISSVRAGNVIGGGDWGKDRLIPDAVRAISASSRLSVRNPSFIRPWQHVLEPISGYLLVGQHLLEGHSWAASEWNFGPHVGDTYTVMEVIEQFKKTCDDLKLEIGSAVWHETKSLMVDSTKAMNQLSWSPIWSTQQSIDATARWYRHFLTTGEPSTDADIHNYVAASVSQKAIWTRG